MFATVREAASTASVQLDAVDFEDLTSQLRNRFGSRMTRILELANRDQERLVILLNGRNIAPSRIRSVKFSDGDEIAIFPPVSGG